MTTYCTRSGKIQHTSWHEAYRRLRKQSKKHRRVREGAVYRCPYCGNFHISSRKQEE